LSNEEKKEMKQIVVKNSIWKILKIESTKQETSIGDIVEQLVLAVKMNDDSINGEHNE